MKRLCVIVLMVALLIGAFTSIGVSQERKVKPGTIGFSLPFATAPFYWACANGLKDEMEKMGYKVVITVAANDPNLQFQQLENFRVEKVQGAAIIAYDFPSVSPAIDKIRKTGIPFFAIDRDVSADVDCFLITDNRKAGSALAKFVIQELKGEKAYIVKDYFAVEVVPLVERVDGFMEEMEKSYKDKYEVIQTIGGAGGGGDPFEAHIPLFKDAILRNRNANVFILGTDLLAKPAVTALKELNMFVPAGQKGHRIIIGVDGNPETLDAIRKKEVTGCFSQYPYLQGVWAGIMMDKWIQGRKDIIPKALYFGGDVVNYKNVQEFKNLWGDIKWKQID